MKEKLQINAASDGTWLTFNSSKGTSATFRLESLAEKQSEIIKQAIIDWCDDEQREARTP